MSSHTPKNWFKPVAWAALIWNLLGVIAFIMHIMTSPDMISKLPLDQQAAILFYEQFLLVTVVLQQY